jgi:hypothetical protein
MAEGVVLGAVDESLEGVGGGGGLSRGLPLLNGGQEVVLSRCGGAAGGLLGESADTQACCQLEQACRQLEEECWVIFFYFLECAPGGFFFSFFSILEDRRVDFSLFL